MIVYTIVNGRRSGHIYMYYANIPLERMKKITNPSISIAGLDSYANEVA
jgi:hypothetical protein